MKENFDATQFITFDVSGECEYIINPILERFHNLGFEVLLEKDIRNVKRRYFSKYKKGVFMELKDDTFLGEIEFWKVDSEMPTERIKSFVEQLNWIYNQKEIYNLSLILTGFAEEEFSSNTVIKVSPEDITNAISAMSKYYFDIWTDNLVVEII